MLQIAVPSAEFYDEASERFITVKGAVLQLEHSLVSISKWESKWKKPFLGKGQKSREETIDYIRCMTITQKVDPMVYRCLTEKNIMEVNAYIDDSMTATTFRDIGKKGSSGIITNEIIYYWMIALEVPMECQKWHLNRLLTLIRVCDEKSSPKKKMGKKEAAAQRRSLNAARRMRSGSKG